MILRYRKCIEMLHTMPSMWTAYEQPFESSLSMANLQVLHPQADSSSTLIQQRSPSLCPHGFRTPTFTLCYGKIRPVIPCKSYPLVICHIAIQTIEGSWIFPARTRWIFQELCETVPEGILDHIPSYILDLIYHHIPRSFSP